MTGKNIRQAQDILMPVTVERIIKGLTTPDTPLHSMIERLRMIKTIDPNQYRRMKTDLPYLVCGQFHPCVRRKENFMHTDCLILDLDHVTTAGHSPKTLKAKLCEDERIMLAFTSPGGDGLKLLFCLHSKIDDAAYFTLFYKKFAAQFAMQYGLETLVDLKTCDVSRCCFMSYDENAWYRADATTIDVTTYVNPNEINDLDQDLRSVKEFAQKQKTVKEAAAPQPMDRGPGPEALVLIKEKLLIMTRKRKAADVMQPEELEGLQQKIEGLLKDAGLPVLKAIPISYGKQLRIGSPTIWAEINIFYGKRGASIVPTTRTGSNQELANMVTEMLRTHV